ncbi:MULTISPECIES: hypothetical protein [Rhizobium]|uniref:Uncharacterized protein n=1 Tax=Rhizobium paranaense TaxID=1650438 RepID=A0A7W8XQQ9_9HYPH|nr:MULTISPECIES: hypothetical protein [Rhizobium]MBB5573862.1 hypothetical protein [Rhizobium paranaense]PST61417.1 hypothetical protein C9E91_18580 [Rhizobium sp. SEMIA4064]
MLLKALTISALIVGASSVALAGPAHKHRTTTFDAQAIQTDFGVVDHSKDAILPDGTINTDPSVTGPIRAGDAITRLQCAAAPNAVGVSNTYAAGPTSRCPGQ